jgi:hypothetical protein
MCHQQRSAFTRGAAYPGIDLGFEIKAFLFEFGFAL